MYILASYSSIANPSSNFMDIRLFESTMPMFDRIMKSMSKHADNINSDRPVYINAMINGFGNILIIHAFDNLEDIFDIINISDYSNLRINNLSNTDTEKAKELIYQHIESNIDLY